MQEAKSVSKQAVEYQIIKVLNNNVILAFEKENHQEMILVSKGIGFGKKENNVIQLTDEKRVFSANRSNRCKGIGC